MLAARERLLNALKSEGYALAKVDEPIAILEPARNALDVTYKVTSGPRVDLGEISVEGLERVNRSFVDRRLLRASGRAVQPRGARESAPGPERDWRLFLGARRYRESQLDSEGRLPITFDVTERPRHAVSFGAAYSTDLGAVCHGDLVAPEPVRQCRATQSHGRIPDWRQRPHRAWLQCEHSVHQAGLLHPRSRRSRPIWAR